MKYKDGVYTKVTKIVKGVEVSLKQRPQIEYAKTVADEVSNSITGIEGVVTAIFDGKHMAGSKHYTGEAFDFRTNHYLPSDLEMVYDDIKKTLGSDYDCILHDGSHLHIEYDPK